MTLKGKHKVRVREGIGCVIERGRKPKGRWMLQVIRKGIIVHEEPFENAVVDAGANSLLGVNFHADTQITAWYVGLVDNASFSAFSNADTMASHAGWIENVAYSGGVRPTWSPGAPSGRAITNASPFTFTMTGSAVLKGVFVCSDNTLSGTTGTLWSEAAFGSLQSVGATDLVKLIYTVSL